MADFEVSLAFFESFIFSIRGISHVRQNLERQVVIFLLGDYLTPIIITLQTVSPQLVLFYHIASGLNISHYKSLRFKYTLALF